MSPFVKTKNTEEFINDTTTKERIGTRPVLNGERIEKSEWLKPRLISQLGFAALIIWIGWEFVEFVGRVRSDLPVSMSDRPPGVEGFLPISSLMELWLLLKSGIALTVHPAGVVIISFAVISAILMRRGFCSWFCPVGLVSEVFTRLGIKLGIMLTPPKWLDIPLRSLKYILLALFLYVILGMSTQALQVFISGEYNIVSDVKMLDYFNPPSRLTWSVLGILALLTLLLKNFWCRYLCPYGALLALFSRISPMKIRRDTVTCIDCGLCDKECPSYLPVATSSTIRSEECLSCQQCTAVCPVKDCLYFSLPGKKFKVKPIWYGVAFAALFLIMVGLARFGDYWYGKTDIETYTELAKKADILSHPRSLDGYSKQ
ncbi:4Fe-4S binding protein [candidate division KSB1 bacterium]